MEKTIVCECQVINAQQLNHLSTAVIIGKRTPHKAILLLVIMDDLLRDLH